MPRRKTTRAKLLRYPFLLPALICIVGAGAFAALFFLERYGDVLESVFRSSPIPQVCELAGACGKTGIFVCSDRAGRTCLVWSDCKAVARECNKTFMEESSERQGD